MHKYASRVKMLSNRSPTSFLPPICPKSTCHFQWTWWKMRKALEAARANNLNMSKYMTFMVTGCLYVYIYIYINIYIYIYIILYFAHTHNTQTYSKGNFQTLKGIAPVLSALKINVLICISRSRTKTSWSHWHPQVFDVPCRNSSPASFAAVFAESWDEPTNVSWDTRPPGSLQPHRAHRSKTLGQVEKAVFNILGQFPNREVGEEMQLPSTNHLPPLASSCSSTHSSSEGQLQTVDQQVYDK